MPDIQIFWSFWNAGGRIHFATIPDDIGNYQPYDGIRYEYSNRKRHSSVDTFYKFPGYVTRKNPFSSFADLILGYKNLHFDMWTSIPKPYSPLFSVSFYYHTRQKYGKHVFTNHEHKGIRIPDLLEVLHYKRFKKRLAQAAILKNTPSEGLGALFG